MDWKLRAGPPKWKVNNELASEANQLHLFRALERQFSGGLTYITAVKLRTASDFAEIQLNVHVII